MYLGKIQINPETQVVVTQESGIEEGGIFIHLYVKNKFYNNN